MIKSLENLGTRSTRSSCMELNTRQVATSQIIYADEQLMSGFLCFFMVF